MILKNKINIILILFILIILAAFIFENEEAHEEIIISACDTCYFEFKDKITEPFQIVRSASTAESLRLLNIGEAEYALVGRTLKDEEKKLIKNNTGIVIRNGYSFLSKNSLNIKVDELENYEIYTDQNIHLIKDIFDNKKIHFVDDVYRYLYSGIIITSWENTDYNKANIVHVFNHDNQRFSLSRQPTLYCKESCLGEESQKLIDLLVQ